MKGELLRADIDMAKIPADGNIGGLLFAVGTIVIFLIGVPAIRILFPAAIAIGCGVALVLRFVHGRVPKDPLILPVAGQNGAH